MSATSPSAALDGLVNSNLLKQHYRSRSQRVGAEYLDRVYVHSIDVSSSEVRLGCWQGDHPLSDDGLVRMMTQDGPGEAEPGHLFELCGDALAITGGDNRSLGNRTRTQRARRAGLSPPQS